MPPKKLKLVTRQDALEMSVRDVMNSLYNAIGTTYAHIPCANLDNHYCNYNAMIEWDWLERPLFVDAPPEVYMITNLGADSWCYQFLKHHFDNGPIVELVNHVFDKSPEDLQAWKDIVQEHRISESINNDKT